MCFSATASFTASALLSTGGLVAISHTKNIRALPLASIPLIFGIQQSLEGLVWISHPTSLTYYLGMYGFLFCAYALWPILVPWGTVLYEGKTRDNPPLLAIAAIGTVVGGYFFSELLRGNIHASIVQHSICYSFKPELWFGMGLSYIFVVVFAGLFARNYFMKVFGVGLAATFIFSRYVTELTYVSIWCFFGALLSGVILWHFLYNARKNTTPIQTISTKQKKK